MPKWEPHQSEQSAHVDTQAHGLYRRDRQSFTAELMPQAPVNSPCDLNMPASFSALLSGIFKPHDQRRQWVRDQCWGRGGCNGNILTAKSTPLLFSSLLTMTVMGKLISDSQIILEPGDSQRPWARSWAATTTTRPCWTSANSNPPVSFRFPAKSGSNPAALSSSPSAPCIDQNLRGQATHLTLKRPRNRELEMQQQPAKGMNTKETSCVCFQSAIAGLRRKPSSLFPRRFCLLETLSLAQVP